MLDFADNYSTIVQDAAQGFHWNNSQATIHPFVLYYMDENTNSVQQNRYASVSYHTIYNTIAIYTFAKKLLLEYLKPSFPQTKKVIYFSDSSQGFQLRLATSNFRQPLNHKWPESHRA